MAPLYPADSVPIIGIHRHDFEDTLATDIIKGLDHKDGDERTMPTLLLYDTRGLRLFEDITYVDEYYLTNAEIDVLTTHAKAIAKVIPADAQIVELGSGNLRKVDILLQEFERIGKPVAYYALDLSLEELRRTFAEISTTAYQHVRCYGLHGTYDDGLSWLQKPANRCRPTCILSMGSSIGNFTREAAKEFLAQFAEILGPDDSMMVGLDACKDPTKVYQAYNDSQGVTRKFYENGLSRANEVLGTDAFKPGEWEAIGAYDADGGRHWAYYTPLKDLTVQGIALKKGEKIRFEESYKYSTTESTKLWRGAGLTPRAIFGNATDDYHLHMLSPAALHLPVRARQYATGPVPTTKDFESLWKAWDIVTKDMIPDKELLSKPIKLRNNLIFYLGHIPTFSDIHVTRATGGLLTEPSYYPSIFERGIDPDVDNPEHCHKHSEIPEEWPPLAEINEFQGRVRDRVRSILESDQAESDPTLAEALWISFEHEVMHLETFLYMLLQSEKTLPPPGVETPDFKRLAAQAAAEAVPNEWFQVPAQTLSIGLDEPENGHLPQDSFGWDNEKPRRLIHASAFEAKGRPITNGEFASFLERTHATDIPASWMSVLAEQAHQNGVHMNGFSNGTEGAQLTASDKFLSGYSVRTVFGPVPLKYAVDWPVIASYDELSLYAEWQNCRLPTFEEVKSIYKYSAEFKERGEDSGANFLNGTNGEKAGLDYPSAKPPKPRAPDHQPVQKGSLNALPVYIDLDNCNVGLKHWQPTPVTHNGNRLSGQGELGGVWEWTSSPIKAHEGFKAMDIYPGYTSDFFDGKHHIVLGSSWATHPRIAGRTTFVNWFQRNYPYAWAGARLVRDI